MPLILHAHLSTVSAVARCVMLDEDNAHVHSNASPGVPTPAVVKFTRLLAWQATSIGAFGILSANGSHFVVGDFHGSLSADFHGSLSEFAHGSCTHQLLLLLVPAPLVPHPEPE